MTFRMWPAVAAGIGILCLAIDGRAAEQEISAGSVAALMSDGGSSGRDARRAAIEAMPLERMNAAQRHTVEKCLQTTTLYRHLPTKTFPCDGDLLAFSLHNPEAIVDLWRVLGISRLSLDPVGPQQWRLDDGYGTVGVLRLVHHEHDGRRGTLVFHGRGAYTGPLSPRMLTGSCVLLVRHTPAGSAADGRALQRIDIDAFLDMDGVGLEVVTRTLQPLIVRSAASNFSEICIFMASLSRAAEANPDGVARLAGRLPRTAPGDKQSLADIARSIGEGGVQRAAAGDDVTVQTELAARWQPAAR
ncbi:MAG: hypothetical protein ACKOYJ_11615 [Planctomycetia bacterium]